MIKLKTGTLERVLLDKMIEFQRAGKGGVTFLDLEGTGITEENIGQIATNLKYGIFEIDEDNAIKFDS